MFVLHELPPVYDENSRVLILGTLPSPLSRKVRFYYGNPQNRFWATLAGVYEEEMPTTNDEKITFLLRHRIALWDVIAACDIEGAADSSIKNPVPNDFSVILDYANIKQIFTTGKTAFKYFKKFTGMDSVCLPSPSPANCAVSLPELVKAYGRIRLFTDD